MLRSYASPFLMHLIQKCILAEGRVNCFVEDAVEMHCDKATKELAKQFSENFFHHLVQVICENLTTHLPDFHHAEKWTMAASYFLEEFMKEGNTGHFANKLLKVLALLRYSL